MNRNSFELESFKLAPVFDFSIFTGVSVFAGDDDIDDFILHDAEHHFKHRMAVTYILTTPPDPQILAFATLQNDAIKFSGGYDNFPYRSYPAVKIGRLGVLQSYQGQGIGSLLIKMIAEFMCQENRTGCRFITLDAYNTDKTIRFYQKNAFEMLKPKANRRGRQTIPMFRDLL